MSRLALLALILLCTGLAGCGEGENAAEKVPSLEQAEDEARKEITPENADAALDEIEKELEAELDEGR